MTVNELIEKLNNYNKKADVNIVVNGHPLPFEICYGASEGCTPEDCNSVDIMVETECETG